MYTHILRTGRQIIIDDEDKHYLFEYSVNTLLSASKYTRYAVLSDLITHKYITLLHRMILKPPPNILLDHINGNGLDCRKENLRYSDNSLNQQNRRLHVLENEVKGLFYRADRNCWSAKITVRGKVIYLGHFLNKEDAIIARLNAEEIYHPHRGDGTAQIIP